MKTELKIPESKPELKFPLLAQSVHREQVVLFEDRTSGTVVCRGMGHWGVGHCSRSWTDVTDVSTWTILPPGTQLILTVE